MRFGLQIPNFTTDETPGALFAGVVDRATAAEETGYDSVWVMDHFYQLPPMGGPSQPMLDAYTLLGALATQTSRVRLGTMVTGVTYRNPAHLAKIVTTLDVLSAGTGHPRHRRGVVRRGARGPGLRFPAGRRAAGPPGGGAADLPRHVHRGGPVVRRSLLPDPRGAQRAGTGAAGRPSHPHRRWRREADACSWWRATPT